MKKAIATMLIMSIVTIISSIALADPPAVGEGTCPDPCNTCVADAPPAPPVVAPVTPPAGPAGPAGTR